MRVSERDLIYIHKKTTLTYMNVVKHQKSHKYLYIIYIIYSKCVYICKGPFQVSFLQKASKHMKHIILIKAV